MIRERKRLLNIDGIYFFYFVLFMMPFLLYYAVGVYSKSIRMGVGDLYVDYWSYGFQLFEKRPLLYIVSALIGDFFYVYLLFYFVILIAYKNVLRRVSMFRRYDYIILFIVFLVPYGAVTFYGNILYNGVALSFVIFSFYSEKIIFKVVFFVFGLLLHFKAVILFVFLFILPYVIYVYLNRRYYWLYLFSLFICVFLVLKSNLYGISDLFSLDEDALYKANYFVEGIRDEQLLRFKLIVFFVFGMLIVKNFGGGLIDKVAKDILYSTNLAALGILLIPNVPFVERFVQPQVQFSVIVLVANAYLYFFRVLLGRRYLVNGRY